MRFLMVVKLVSMPPSQRLFTNGWLARIASSLNRFVGLLLRADEEDLVTAGDGLTHEFEGDVQALDGLGEIDDVDPVALREDERAHLGVPAASLVAEVDSGFQQLPHRDGRHGVRPPVVRSSAGLVVGDHGDWPRHHPERDDPRVSSTP